MLRLREIIYKIYHETTGKSVKTISRDCERNKWMDAEEMLAYGLVDKILQQLPKSADKSS